MYFTTPPSPPLLSIADVSLVLSLILFIAQRLQSNRFSSEHRNVLRHVPEDDSLYYYRILKWHGKTQSLMYKFKRRYHSNENLGEKTCIFSPLVLSLQHSVLVLKHDLKIDVSVSCLMIHIFSLYFRVRQKNLLLPLLERITQHTQ